MRYWCSSSYSRGLMVYRSAVRVMGSIGRLGRPFESVDERLSSLAGRGESILAPGRRGGYSVDMYCVEVERRLRYICVDDQGTSKSGTLRLEGWEMSRGK